MNTPVNFGEELARIIRGYLPQSTMTHLSTLPARYPSFSPWPQWVSESLRQTLEDLGIENLYSHQAQTADLALARKHVVIATGTSSGKSLGYLLPILSVLAVDPTACAMYITPTKALGSDQLINASRIINATTELRNIHPAPYDGDTPTEARSGIRDLTRFVFTNPDMVHSSLLANHQRWARLFRHLEYIVIDECHSYRGVFGAHVSLTLRRLLRIAAFYNSHPTVILASATSSDPADHASKLIGAPVSAVTEDGSPTGQRTIMLWEPGFIEGKTGENDAPVRRAASSESASIMSRLIAEGARTLTFVRSRRQAELAALKAQEELSLLGNSDLARRVASYRAGYLAEDRRVLERKLDNGDLLGVATTNALELGIDIGGLDAIVMAGFPGTIASFWQQAGRAGRRRQGSLAVLVARDEPMDTYLVHNPAAILNRPIESAIFNPSNPHILRGHIYCAAVEKPLTEEDVSFFDANSIVKSLESDGFLRKRAQGWFAVHHADYDETELNPDTAHTLVNIRGGSGSEFMIVDTSDGRLLGTIDSSRAMSQIHPGAVYLHQGESFVINDLDIENLLAFARPESPDYSTYARSETTIHIVNPPADNEVVDAGGGLWVANVDVEVIDKVTGYITKLADGTTLDSTPLSLPAQHLYTRAVAYTIDPLALTAMGISAADVPGALHASEHAAIGMLPLLATCDRWDIGGVSTALHPDTGYPTVFVYDGFDGGAGFADCGFRRFSEWIEATFEAVRSCSCDSGCPSCVQSPKCGNGNNPLNKAGAIKLLGAMVTLLKK